MTNKDMTEKFVCPGCVCGSDTKCGVYEPNGISGCRRHVIGTSVNLCVPFALGLPVGFCRPGLATATEYGRWLDIYLFTQDDHDVLRSLQDEMNVIVWYHHDDGFLFMRMYMPRINTGVTMVCDLGEAHVEDVLTKDTLVRAREITSEFIDEMN